MIQERQRGDEQVVVEVSIVNDGRVQSLLVSHHILVRLLGDHGGGRVVLWVDVGVQVLDHLGKDLFCLLVEVGN